MKHCTSSRVLACCLVAVFVAMACLSPDRAANGDDSFTAYHSNTPPPINGRLADLESPVWSAGLVATDFTDLTSRTPSQLGTSAYLVYDDTNLYVAFRCEQDALPITARQRRNGEAVALDDTVSVGIDTSGNGSRVYTFQSTPRGLRNQSSSESTRYDPLWRAVGSIEGTTWVSEMVIPLRILRADAVDSWRINFTRHIATEERNLSWAFDPQMQDGFDSTYWRRFAELQVSTRVTRPGPRVDVFGLANAGGDRNRFEQTSGEIAEKPARNTGVDLSYPLTSTVSFVAAVNPDFSNVESDQASLAPTQFERRLIEYRPFFAQGASYFPALSGGNTLFYSPAIGVFDRGLKVEGTAGAYSMAALEFAGTGFRGNDSTHFDDTAFALTRTAPDGSLTAFLQGTQAHHTDARDTAFAFGARHKNQHSGFVLSLDVANEDGTRNDPASSTGTGKGHDHSFNASVGVERAAVSYAAGYRDIGPSYAPLDGYTEINDVRGPFVYGSANYAGKPGSRLRSLNFSFNGDRFLDRAGAVRLSDIGLSTTATFKNLLSVGASLYDSSLRTYDAGYPSYVNPQTLRYRQASIALGFRESTDSPLNVSYSWGPYAQGCTSVESTDATCLENPDRYVPVYLQQFGISTTRQLAPGFALSLGADNTLQRPVGSGTVSNSWLVRAAIDLALRPDENISLSLREVTGSGGAYAAPGFNLAAGYRRRFANANELTVVYGTPASARTLNRFLVKYLIRLGAAGT